jgi:type II secretory pathway component PulK
MMAPIATADATDRASTEARREKQRRLRDLAAWYGEFAERAGNPVIWEARLRTAKELEREADTLEEGSVQRRETGFKFPQEYSEICELSGETGESHDE